VSPLVLTNGFPFFLSVRRTMKIPKKWLLAGLALAVVLAFAYLMTTPNRMQEKIDSDAAKVEARFTPQESVDLSMAMKILTHDPPQMLNPPQKVPTLLLFPPSAEDLAKLSGE
jgi:hypothetical protein